MKLLFVRFSSLGDIILTTGVLKHVNRMLPGAAIDVLTFSQYAPIFDKLPFVNEVFAYDKSRGLKEYFYIVQNEFEEHDYIFDLHGKLRSKFLKFHSQADYHCYKKDSKLRRVFVKNKKDNPRLNMHVVEKYFETLQKPLDLAMPDIEELRPVLIRNQEVKKKHIFVHPFASKNTKAYPYAKELAQLLIKEGYTPVFAGIGEAPDVAGVINETGQRNVGDMLDIIDSCEACISSDSGPMHAAIALKKPTVAIFGSTTKHFGFYPSFKSCRVLENNELSCRPCDVHGLDKCPEGHFKCMNALQPELAVRLLSEMLV
ncbi:MAG: glycosyltransferase family 9 protein [Denitrovibrio sp.]|nr:MAG: glycosyltransferase family 9 protein [Denitrovibrio sp.]